MRFGGKIMGRGILLKIIDDTLKGKFLFLLVALLLYIGVSPVINYLIHFKWVLDIFFSIILLSGIYAVSNKKQHAVIASLLALPLFATIWLNSYLQQTGLTIAACVAWILFFGCVLVLFLKYIFSATRITSDVIYAAVIAYLLMGMFWAGVYLLTETIVPGSFDLTAAQRAKPGMLFIYFSFVTLTTLGYGDVTPTADYVYSFAILEAIIGQLYLAVLIARLVGIYKSDASDASPPGRT
jgi:hypothetical protein